MGIYVTYVTHAEHSPLVNSTFLTQCRKNKAIKCCWKCCCFNVS